MTDENKVDASPTPAPTVEPVTLNEDALGILSAIETDLQEFIEEDERDAAEIIAWIKTKF